MIKHRIELGKRLFACWYRRGVVWNLNSKIIEILFKLCVLPAFEYSNNIWGVGDFESNIWKEVEKFWNSIARFIIGVPIRTPICAILGDLGWRPFKFRSFISACKFWTRAIEMNKCRLVYQALCVQRNMYLKNKTCWLSKLYKSLRMSEYGLKVFDNFISINDFHGPCSRKEKKKMDKKVIEYEIRWEKDIEKEIYSWYDKIWWSDISISRQN